MKNLKTYIEEREEEFEKKFGFKKTVYSQNFKNSLKQFHLSTLIGLLEKEIEMMEGLNCQVEHCHDGHFPVQTSEEGDVDWEGCPNCTANGERLEPYKTLSDLITERRKLITELKK